MIKNVDPGRYTLFWMVAGSVMMIGSTDGFIRVSVQEEQVTDLGTITLLGSSESITEREAQR